MSDSDATAYRIGVGLRCLVWSSSALLGSF